MALVTLTQLKAGLESGECLLGLDLGSKTIGVA
ncbi:MAG: Holliday junction resolvase RuvX, partial [Rhodospirillaceae bacterium]|nr:Holliday junction resolvase RuvX [Rhodospirillaceae bacterium]